eukprot:COSAG01_NODE_69424_length_261_cov_0.944444_2_plen_31_part_01
MVRAIAKAILQQAIAVEGCVANDPIGQHIYD